MPEQQKRRDHAEKPTKHEIAALPSDYYRIPVLLVPRETLDGDEREPPLREKVSTCGQVALTFTGEGTAKVILEVEGKCMVVAVLIKGAGAAPETETGRVSGAPGTKGRVTAEATMVKFICHASDPTNQECKFKYKVTWA